MNLLSLNLGFMRIGYKPDCCCQKFMSDTLFILQKYELFFGLLFRLASISKLILYSYG